MKDEEARAVIKLLNDRLNQLNHEIELLRKPTHRGDCECDDCTGCTVDYFCIDLPGIKWFNDSDDGVRPE